MINKSVQYSGFGVLTQRLLGCLLLSVFISACSSGGDLPLNEDANASNDPVTIGEKPAEDPTGSPGPETIATITAAENGLQVSYMTQAQQDSIDTDYVASQWTHMQSCLDIVAPPPRVIIVSGTISLLSPEDDAVRHFDGRVKAASSQQETGVIMQVSEDDFDGTLGEVGGYLRSIMGRFLWLSEQLAERDYPYNCASNG